MSENHNLPLISVIMPIRNEATFIARSLAAVLEQDYPGDRLEVLVADGQSDDDTREVVRRTHDASTRARHEKGEGAPSLHIVDNPGKIVPTGFNAALRRARGKIIVRVDGHTIIAPDYVRTCADILRESGADNVGGRMVAVSTTPTGRAVSLATSSPFGVGGSRFHYSQQEEWVDSVYMGAWPREVFDRIGFFDEEQVRNQDDEFNYRLNKQNGRILLSPRLRSRYYNRSSWRSLWKQYFGYGFWKVRVTQKHPRQMKPRHFAPPLFAALWIALIAMAPFSRKMRRVLAGFALLYSSAIVAASAAALRDARAEDAQEKPVSVFADETPPPPITAKTALHLPPAFAILHFSYGLGFLVGLIKFARRWRGN